MKRATVAIVLVLGCTKPIISLPPPPPPGTPALALITNGLTSPVYAISPPGDVDRLFVVEQTGRIRIVQRDTLLAGNFLDIHTKISSGGERGLLSMAFHPLYALNGRFYVYFTNPNGDIRIVRYTVSADPNLANEASADTVLKVPHPTFSNHNGGQLQFGPDGMLYAGLGDGGSGGDPNGNGQNTHALLGKLLRLNVDGPNGYTVPLDNPFSAGTNGAPEVWAYGLRNPWRFSFDLQTGDLYIADVGQDAWEEVDVANNSGGGAGRGANYGWNILEGTHCYPPGTTCNGVGTLPPVLEYSHDNGACSITGGYVYRGSVVSQLAGQYLYADYCAGFVRSLEYRVGVGVQSTADWTMQLSPGGQISSFGEDARGELYVMTLSGGLYRIIESP